MPSLLFVPVVRITTLPTSCFILLTSFGSSHFCLTLTLFLLHPWSCVWLVKSTMLSINLKWGLSAAWQFWYISSDLFPLPLFSRLFHTFSSLKSLNTSLYVFTLNWWLFVILLRKYRNNQMRTSILIKVVAISTCVSLYLFAIFISIDDTAFCLRPFSLTDSVHIFSKSSFQ